MKACVELIMDLFFQETNQIKATVYLNRASVWQKLFIFAVWNHCEVLRESLK